MDYQKLNSITVPYTYPLPRIDDSLHAAKRTPYMRTIVLRSGYHQLKVRECDIDKSAFTTSFRTDRHLQTPFGLGNAPAIFQRLIDHIRRGHNSDLCFNTSLFR